MSYFVYGRIRMYKIKNENPGSVALYSCAPISNHKLSKDVTSEYVNGGVGCVLFSGRGDHLLSSCFCKQLAANRAFADHG